jgi:DNA-binding XRE family transcriptional regulator
MKPSTKPGVQIMRTTSKERMTGGHNRSVLLPGLRQARQRSGLTQRELSELAGIGKGTIWELETAQRGACPRTVRRLTKALATEVTDLIEE